LKAVQNVIRRAHHPQVYVFRRTRSSESQLQDEPTLEGDRVPCDLRDASEETIKDEELSATTEVRPCCRRRLEPLLQGLLESQ
jgi:hypothetical protein